ncbi:peptide-methionine (S)-S-oxide reductase [Hymenobacter daecheongensis DSM 21074]|uniref:Peptide methionine sulfoxide reductase MsrA n=1 Tax=Hymenobacter daecheongensis DSM 21074 TaxID=1121955 RepID=A0A1M6KS94_9BACT|nr:peptide-methionine (S)-S-oxide reductase MsrA [Hymenobacter daecheongensis]SHJ61809.1 peptide-methionine (S)-S-oxide reductase [Hymenobacter daecheongensis DSM 21074]
METRNFFLSLLLVGGGLASLAFVPMSSDAPAAPTRSTAGPAPRNLTGLAVATFAGGCFWSHEETFEEVRGVVAAVPGYAGGTTPNPTYEAVASEETGHAEAVQVYYNARQVSYQQLLDVFFLGVHNPTELNRQGPDTGTEYRSVAFYRTPQEKQLIAATIRRLDAAHHYPAPIVTQVVPLTQFWVAEAYHQGYYRLHPTQGYIAHVSQPKVEKFRKAFPQLLKPADAL